MSVEEKRRGRQDGGTERWDPHFFTWVNPACGQMPLVQSRETFPGVQSIGLCWRCSRASPVCYKEIPGNFQTRLQQGTAGGMGMAITNWSWCWWYLYLCSPTASVSNFLWCQWCFLDRLISVCIYRHFLSCCLQHNSSIFVSFVSDSSFLLPSFNSTVFSYCISKYETLIK